MVDWPTKAALPYRQDVHTVTEGSRCFASFKYIRGKWETGVLKTMLESYKCSGIFDRNDGLQMRLKLNGFGGL